MLCHTAVSLYGTLTEGEHHIFIQPLVHPLAECHSAVLGEINVTVQLYELVELLQRAFLRFCEC